MLADELLALFDELANVMFCAKSTDLTYTAVNDAFVRRTGRRSKRDVISHTAAELFAPELAERYEEQDQRVFASGEPLRNELELVRRENGELGWYVTVKLPTSTDGVVTGLVSVSRDLATPSDDAIAVESLMDVVQFVRHDLAAPLRVDDLAEVAHCSRAQLERRMKQVFGLSARQFVLRERVDEARRQLIHSDRAIADIAVDTGFYDQADLTKRFVRLTNETPGQYRSQRGLP